MSILRAVQTYLEGFCGMKFLTDQAIGEVDSIAVMPTGNGQIKRDVIGGTSYQNNYVINVCESKTDEVDRAETHDLLERLQDWIDEQSRQGNFPKLPDPFMVEEITASNGMLFEVMDNGLGLYQIQIKLTFTRRNTNA